MNAAISEARKDLSPYAPRIETMMINPERIGDLIGPGGKIINKIIEETNVQIDIEDDGSVFITAEDGEGMAAAKKMIEAITHEIEVGERYEGEVLKIVTDRNKGTEIGAIVDLGGGKDGMVHISNICGGRINKVTDVIKEGEIIQVVVVEIDKERGRIGLSRKDALPKGEPDPKCEAVSADPSRGEHRGSSSARASEKKRTDTHRQTRSVRPAGGPRRTPRVTHDDSDHSTTARVQPSTGYVDPAADETPSAPIKPRVRIPVPDRFKKKND